MSGDRGGSTYNGRSRDVLGKENALSLNDEEVHKLVDVANNGIKGLLGNSVVPARANLGSETAVQQGLANNLSSKGDAQHHPGKLEAPSDDIQISHGEDEGSDGAIGDGGSTWKVLISKTSSRSYR